MNKIQSTISAFIKDVKTTFVGKPAKKTASPKKTASAKRTRPAKKATKGSKRAHAK